MRPLDPLRTAPTELRIRRPVMPSMSICGDTVKLASTSMTAFVLMAFTSCALLVTGMPTVGARVYEGAVVGRVLSEGATVPMQRSVADEPPTPEAAVLSSPFAASVMLQLTSVGYDPWLTVSV